MRRRKPCTRLRYRFLGWKVRLMLSLYGDDGENRGSVPEDSTRDPDTAIVTSSPRLRALRYRYGFATLPARKQTG
jgi:hypothetical protein